MGSSKEANLVWSELLRRMNSNPSVADYGMMNGFLGALTPQLISNDSIILSVDNEWAKNYVETNYTKPIEEELAIITGSSCKMLIVLSEAGTAEEAPKEGIKEGESSHANPPSTFYPAPVQSQVEYDDILPEKENFTESFLDGTNGQEADDIGRLSETPTASGSFSHTFHRTERDSHGETKDIEADHSHLTAASATLPEDKQIEEIRSLDDVGDRKTFENFVVADSNSYAYGAAYSVAENPGTINNPLFIYGRSGLGKTHLLLAIKDYMERNYPNKSVYYTPATSLVEDYVNSLKTNEWGDFNLKYRNKDMLLLDDVQFLETAVETTNEFFKIFNSMISQHKHIVLSADRAPKDINLDERLKSRFANGVTADIQIPQFETKLRIFQNHIEQLKHIHGNLSMDIPSNVVRRVVELSNSNIRNLEGAAASLVVYITYGRKGKEEPISISEAENVVSKIFFTNISEKVTISDIQRFVESYYKVTHGELLGKQRPRHISMARQVGMYLSRTLTQSSYPEIGKAFNKDHTSVVHAYKNIENRRQTDKDFFDELERISDMITESSDH